MIRALPLTRRLLQTFRVWQRSKIATHCVLNYNSANSLTIQQNVHGGLLGVDRQWFSLRTLRRLQLCVLWTILSCVNTHRFVSRVHQVLWAYCTLFRFCFVLEMHMILFFVFVAVCFFLLYALVLYVYCRVLPDVLSLMFFHVPPLGFLK